MRKLPLRSAALTCAAMLSAFGCSPDGPVGPRFAPTIRSALVEAPNILAQAEAGTLGRGEQDFLVRFERDLPGFGGLYISNGAVRVYMKTNTISPTAVRNMFSRVYGVHPNPLVRKAMANVSSATVIQGKYALSELIAIQNRIAASIPGWTGAGTNIMANKVVVGFPDSNALVAGLAKMESAGIPAAALTSIIMPPARMSATFDSYVRPTRGGVLIDLENDSYEPHGIKFNGSYWYPVYYGVGCSLGFNVQTSSGANYFLTAGHCENVWRGVNGATGDSVFQPSRISPPAPVALVGTIVINPPWSQTTCPLNPDTGLRFDFCTDADPALGQYISGPGIYGERKVATSQYGGVNGNPGTDQINNFYDINGVLPPEYVDSIMAHQVAKSGGITFTTSGPFVSDMMDVHFTTPCWPDTHYVCGGPKTILLQKHTVIQADVSGGDSGGAVFTGNPGTGGPYAAMGIVVAASIPYGQVPENPCPSCQFIFSRWDKIEPRVGLGTLNPADVAPPPPPPPPPPSIWATISGTTYMSAGNSCTFSASASGGTAPYAFSWTWQAVNGASAGGYSPSNSTFQLVAQNNTGQVNLTVGVTDANYVHGTTTKVITFGGGSCNG